MKNTPYKEVNTLYKSARAHKHTYKDPIRNNSRLYPVTFRMHITLPLKLYNTSRDKKLRRILFFYKKKEIYYSSVLILSPTK